MRQIGIGLVGVNGQVALHATTGAFCVRRGVCEPHGLVTQDEMFAEMNLTPLDQLCFFGWDLRNDDHLSRARSLTSLALHAARVSEDLASVEVLPAPRVGVSDHVLSMSGVSGVSRACPSRREAVRWLMADLDAVKARRQLDGLVVVNVSSIEPLPSPSPAYESLEAFEHALDQDDPAITPAMLYAYAAIRARAAYVNFTASTSAEIPALQQLALREGTIVAGKDAKTGQTLCKSVLAPMFRLRRLRVEGWYSTNILGNDDGYVLNDASHRHGKIRTKEELLEGLLGYGDVDHQVHIHYFKPSGDSKEAWDNIAFRGWLDTPMSMSLHWRGVDSALAAPLVLDLARLAWFAQAAGEAGVARQLSPFFKAPIDSAELGFIDQMRGLADYCAMHVRRIQSGEKAMTRAGSG